MHVRAFAAWEQELRQWEWDGKGAFHVQMKPHVWRQNNRWRSWLNNVSNVMVLLLCLLCSPVRGYQNEMECPHPLAHFLLSNSALICDFYSTSVRHIIVCHRTFDAAIPRCTSANFTHWRRENYTNSIRFFNFFTLHGSVVDASLYSINFIPTTSWTNAHSFIVFHNNSIGIKCLSIFWRKCSTKLTIIGKYFEYLQFSGFYLLCFKMNGRIKCLRIQK